jgi:hypothetical protein
MSRRRLISLSSVLVLAVGVMSAQAPQGAPAGPPMLDVQKIADNLYVITGGGGNSTVFISQNNGVIVVDAKLPGSGAPLLEKIRSITDQPIMTLSTPTHALAPGQCRLCCVRFPGQEHQGQHAEDGSFRNNMKAFRHRRSGTSSLFGADRIACATSVGVPTRRLTSSIAAPDGGGDASAKADPDRRCQRGSARGLIS